MEQVLVFVMAAMLQALVYKLSSGEKIVNSKGSSTYINQVNETGRKWNFEEHLVKSHDGLVLRFEVDILNQQEDECSARISLAEMNVCIDFLCDCLIYTSSASRCDLEKVRETVSGFERCETIGWFLRKDLPDMMEIYGTKGDLNTFKVHYEFLHCDFEVIPTSGYLNPPVTDSQGQDCNSMVLLSAVIVIGLLLLVTLIVIGLMWFKIRKMKAQLLLPSRGEPVGADSSSEPHVVVKAPKQQNKMPTDESKYEEIPKNPQQNIPVEAEMADNLGNSQSQQAEVPNQSGPDAVYAVVNKRKE